MGGGGRRGGWGGGIGGFGELKEGGGGLVGGFEGEKGGRGVLVPSFKVRSSGGGWSSWEGEGEGEDSWRRGGVELVNQISGKRERSVRTWARARHGIRGVGVGNGRCLKLGAKACCGGFKPCLGTRRRGRRDVFLIRRDGHRGLW